MGNLKSIKDKAKNLFIDSVQSTCGGIHLGLKYTIDGVEIIESTVVHRMTGQDSNSVRNTRRRCTIKRQKEISDAYNKMKERIKDMSDVRFGSTTTEISDDIQSEML